jgi:hypothetical protein
MLDYHASPRVLVLASRYDLSCDYVIAALLDSEIPYLRLNTEDLPHFELVLDPLTPRMRGISAELSFEISAQQLRGIYYRQPTFLREASLSGRPINEQFARAQWAAFVRSLMVFDECVWINHPVRTYESEHKAVQLLSARRIGFNVLPTVISNSERFLDTVAGPNDCVAVKGVDTVLVREGETECFGYTLLLDRKTIRLHELRSAPSLFQQGMRNKLDLRITVIGEHVWCAAVTRDGRGIEGDWRLAKTDAEFTEFDLPKGVKHLCIQLVRELGLTFGAIDLVLVEGSFYFLEINPTGEWAWLQAGLEWPIADGLVKSLSQGNANGPT